MTEYDIDFLRQMQSELQGIPLCNNRMTFFYDETGNCGKFKVTETGFNDPMALTRDFILGGVAFDGDECPADVDSLFSSLNLKKDAVELKFRHISRKKSEFLEWFGAKRASVFIRWLHESGLYIHYALINNLYYSLVDMVDTLWESQPQFVFSSEWVIGLKSALYTFCKAHVDDVLTLFRKYNYPDVALQDTKDFCQAFCFLIQSHSDDYTPEDFLLECFRQMLKTAGKENKLALLHDNEAGILVDQYYTMYFARCYIYKNAMHHFDEESIIEHLLSETVMISEGIQFKNYDFCTSQENPLTQICDAFVGLISRAFKYLDQTAEADILLMDRPEYRGVIENMSILWKLIERSDAKHPMLIQNVNDIQTVQRRMRKMQLFCSMNDNRKKGS